MLKCKKIATQESRMLVLQVSIFIQNTNKNQYQSLNYIQFIKLLLINLMIFLWSIGHARVEENSVMYLINLWWPSICQRTRGDWTLCCLLLTATLQCCITLMGSGLKRDCLILSCCTQCPLLCSNPFTILITIWVRLLCRCHKIIQFSSTNLTKHT